MSIDQRIVEMQFQNKQFESGIQSSIKSLGNLKDGLKLDGAKRGLADLERTGRSFSLSNIAQGVDQISSKFSALGIIGVTALMNITNSAINAGSQMIKSLTIDPIMSGFSKYEQKTNAVQTIMNATGLEIGKVEESLERLQWFTDETSYSFVDMVSNIGKFTSQGVDLDVAATAMQGIATWAALSGANAQTASGAMYQLAKSIGIGSVRLMEWQSIENANMGTLEFKQTAIDTAIAMGKLTKAAKNAKGEIVGVGNFSQTLASGWFNQDVLLATLDKYGDYANAVYEESTEKGITAYEAMKLVNSETMDLGARAFRAAQEAKTFTDAIDAVKEAVSSGWMQSFEIMFGNYVESVEVWSSVTDALYDVFATGGYNRNELLAEWKELGGRDLVIEGIANMFNALLEAVEPVTEAFREFFPAMNPELLVAMSEKFRDFTEGLFMTEETADKVKRTFRGIFAVADMLRKGLGLLGRVVGDLAKKLAPAGAGLLDFTANMGDFLVELSQGVDFAKAFESITDRIGRVVTGITNAVTGLKNFIVPIGKSISGAVTKIVNSFKEFKGVDLSGLDALTDRMMERFAPITAFGEGVKKVFIGIANGFKKVAPFFLNLARIIGDVFSKLQKIVLEAMQNAGFDTIADAINGGLLVAILVTLQRFMAHLAGAAKNFKWSIESITDILDQVRHCLLAWQMELKARALLKIAFALGILTLSLLVLTLIDSKKLTGALVAMSAMFAQLIGAMAIFTKVESGLGLVTIGKLTMAMVGISLAILILSLALNRFAKMDKDELAQGVMSIAALAAILVVAAKALANNAGRMMSGAFGLILFGFAIHVLASAVKKLGTIDPAEATKGLLIIGVILAELALFMKFTNNGAMAVSTGVGILALAFGLSVLAGAVRKFGKMDGMDLQKGIYAIFVLLTTISLFLWITRDSERVIATAIGIGILAVAMHVLVGAVKKMGQIPMDEIGRGLLVMAGSLAIIGIAMHAMALAFPSIGALLGVSLAMFIFTGVISRLGTMIVNLSKALKTLSTMSWNEIGKGLFVLAASLAILAVAMKFMSVAMSGALALIVVSMAVSLFANTLVKLGKLPLPEIGKSLLILAGIFAVIGLAAFILAPLAPVILALSASLVLLGVGLIAIGLGMFLFSAGLATLAVSGTAGAAALVVIVTSIIGLIPLIIEKIGEGLLALAKILGEGAPAIADALVKLVDASVQGLLTILPTLVNALVQLILLLVDTLLVHVPHFVDVGLDLITAFLIGLTEKIPALVDAGVDLITAFLIGVSSKLGDIVDAAFKIIINFINGLAEAIRANHAAIYAACENLVDAIIEALLSMGDSFRRVGENMINGIIQGFKNRRQAMKDATKEGLKGMVEGAKNFLGIKSPSTVFAEIGKNSALGLVEGLKKYAGKVGDEAAHVGGVAKDTLTGAISGIADIINGDIDLNPSIRPVLDLTDVKSGSRTLASMMGGGQSLSVATAGMASSMRVNGGGAVQHALHDLKGVLKDIADNSHLDLTGKLDVQIRNDRNEIVGIAQAAMTDLLRKGSRR